MGGKNKPDNSSVVQEQQQEAAQEAQKEAARQVRINQGLASIRQAFEGSPVLGPKAFDWSTFQAPSRYMSPQMAAVAANNPGANGLPSASETTASGVPTGYTATQQGGQWGLSDASGKFYAQGTPLTYQAPTGATTGGFDDAFYDKYKQAVLDYYQPQVDKQYTDAKKQAAYGLGRSGNLISSAANDLMADLKGQYDINTHGVRNQADTAAGDLRSQVNSRRAESHFPALRDRGPRGRRQPSHGVGARPFASAAADEPFVGAVQRREHRRREHPKSRAIRASKILTRSPTPCRRAASRVVT